MMDLEGLVIGDMGPAGAKVMSRGGRGLVKFRRGANEGEAVVFVVVVVVVSAGIAGVASGAMLVVGGGERVAAGGCGLHAGA